MERSLDTKPKTDDNKAKRIRNNILILTIIAVLAVVPLGFLLIFGFAGGFAVIFFADFFMDTYRLVLFFAIVLIMILVVQNRKLKKV